MHHTAMQFLTYPIAFWHRRPDFIQTPYALARCALTGPPARAWREQIGRVQNTGANQPSPSLEGGLLLLWLSLASRPSSSCTRSSSSLFSRQHRLQLLADWILGFDGDDSLVLAHVSMLRLLRKSASTCHYIS